LENLYAYIKHVTGLSEKGWNAVKSVLTKKNYQKGDYLLSTGELCNSIFYIQEGYCRAHYDYGGQPINTNFYFESEFATNIRSLKQGIGSEYAIQAEEDMVVIIFDRDKLYTLFDKSVEVDAMGRKLMEGILAQQEEQAELFKLNSASLRYDYMQKIQPQIIKRIPLEHIASYLGMSLETLVSIHKGHSVIS